MRVRNWDGLGNSQRTRYQRAGISRRDYESGISLSAARGHGQTPERPERANETKHAAYIAKRTRDINAVFAIKEGIWGQRPKWNAKRARANVARSPFNGHWRGKPELTKILKLAESWSHNVTHEPALNWGDESNDMVNAFYYH